MVVRLRKCLDHLKQSSYIMYGTFMDFMIFIGFMASCVNGGLFVLQDHGIVVASVIGSVDDLLIISSKGFIGPIKDHMKKRFRMHDLGSVSFYLSMNMECNWEQHTIDIHQHSYIWTILGKFRMYESRPVAMPMAINLEKWKLNEVACDPTIYKSTIGSRMCAMTANLPCIAYAIAVPSR